MSQKQRSTSVRSSFVNQEAKALIDKIRLSYKKSLKSLIGVGGHLQRLRELLCRQEFQKAIKSIGLSEIQASRLINLHTRFKDHQTKAVLGSKVSVLYLLASGQPSREVARLMVGQAVKIDGTRKTIDTLTVKDASHLSRPQRRIARRRIEVSNDRLYVTRLEELNDQTSEIILLRRRNKLKNHAQIKLVMEDAVKCLKQAIAQM
ncbi:hypothetical protein [Bdellovibrio bacteriovorus]|uniref:hypothetical protein n=1 Tax=Bdellovibrio bacteriovorus TaxID=959 RepID=UPI00059ED961|nr:hypothetical protein [Bdellovibrio bacteriovorus]